MIRIKDQKQNDLFDLVTQFKDHPEIETMHSYKLLERVLKEQCNVNVSDDKKPVEVKKPKDIPSDSLQNIFRATAVRKAVNDDKAAHERGLSGQMHAIYVIKEHLLMAWSQLKKLFVLFIRSYGRMTITTA